MQRWGWGSHPTIPFKGVCVTLRSNTWQIFFLNNHRFTQQEIFLNILNNFNIKTSLKYAYICTSVPWLVFKNYFKNYYFRNFATIYQSMHVAPIERSIINLIERSTPHMYVLLGLSSILYVRKVLFKDLR